MIFWEGVRAHGDPQSYWSALRESSDEDLHESVAHHVYTLAEISSTKFAWVNRSVAASYVGAVLAGIALVFG